MTRRVTPVGGKEEGGEGGGGGLGGWGGVRGVS